MEVHTGLTRLVLECIGTTGHTVQFVTECVSARQEYRAVNPKWLRTAVRKRLTEAVRKGWCYKSNDKPALYAQMPT